MINNCVAITLYPNVCVMYFTGICSYIDSIHILLKEMYQKSQIMISNIVHVDNYR